MIRKKRANDFVHHLRSADSESNAIPGRRYCTVHIHIDPGRLCKKSQSESAIAYRDSDPSRGKHKPRTKVQHTTKLASRTLAINQSQRISKYNIDRSTRTRTRTSRRKQGTRKLASATIASTFIGICLRLAQARSGSTESISNRPGLLFFLSLYSASDSESILSFPSVSVLPDLTDYKNNTYQTIGFQMEEWKKKDRDVLICSTVI